MEKIPMPPYSVLLPDRHPEPDFFIADIFDTIPLKDDRHTMEYPFFSLSTKKNTNYVEYVKGDVKICMSPSAKYGLPTIFDKDILLYCGSIIISEINKENVPSKTIRFSARDLLVTTNRDTNGEAYQMLKNAFERLAGCLITTNIKTNRRQFTEGFHLIESYRVVKESHDKSRMVEVEVRVSEWFYNALLGREVLTINRNYFRLRKPIERRLYELARKHCGKQDFWEIRLDNLHAKVGSASELRKFRLQVRQIIETDRSENHFPDYQMTLSEKDTVTFTHKPDSTVLDLEFKKKAFVSAPVSITLQDLFQDVTGRSQQTVIKLCQYYRYDFMHLAEEFTAFVQKKGMPKNPSGAFVNFAKKKFEQKMK